jgi:hypothetical protein
MGSTRGIRSLARASAAALPAAERLGRCLFHIHFPAQTPHLLSALDLPVVLKSEHMQMLIFAMFARFPVAISEPARKRDEYLFEFSAPAI